MCCFLQARVLRVVKGIWNFLSRWFFENILWRPGQQKWGGGGERGILAKFCLHDHGCTAGKPHQNGLLLSFKGRSGCHPPPLLVTAMKDSQTAEVRLLRVAISSSEMGGTPSALKSLLSVTAVSTGQRRSLSVCTHRVSTTHTRPHNRRSRSALLARDCRILGCVWFR